MVDSLSKTKQSAMALNSKKSMVNSIAQDIDSPISKNKAKWDTFAGYDEETGSYAAWAKLGMEGRSGFRGIVFEGKASVGKETGLWVKALGFESDWISAGLSAYIGTDFNISDGNGSIGLGANVGEVYLGTDAIGVSFQAGLEFAFGYDGWQVTTNVLCFGVTVDLAEGYNAVKEAVGWLNPFD